MWKWALISFLGLYRPTTPHIEDYEPCASVTKALPGHGRSLTVKQRLGAAGQLVAFPHVEIHVPHGRTQPQSCYGFISYRDNSRQGSGQKHTNLVSEFSAFP